MEIKNKNIIYLDNAATTKMSQSAKLAMLPYFDEIYGNPSSLHSVGQAASEALADARARIAACFGCDASEIYFTSGGSEADSFAIMSAARAGAARGRKHIISSCIEHHAVLNALKQLKRDGFDITILDVDKNGKVSPSDVAQSIRSDTCLVSIMYANNEIGTLEPIYEIGKICREANVTFHTDAVQAAGHVAINVKNQCIDMMSVSAHKFHGPKGIGALYAKKGTILSPVIYGGAQERGKRGGTEALPLIVGMVAALEESIASIEQNTKKMTCLRDRLIDGILKIPHCALNGDKTDRLSSNASFCFEGIEGESLLLLLDDRGICASSGSACTSGSLDPSHVLLSIGRPHDVAHGSLRLSLSPEISEEDIDMTIDAVRETVQYLRAISPVWRDLMSGKREFIL